MILLRTTPQNQAAKKRATSSVCHKPVRLDSLCDRQRLLEGRVTSPESLAFSLHEKPSSAHINLPPWIAATRANARLLSRRPIKSTAQVHTTRCCSAALTATSITCNESTHTKPTCTRSPVACGTARCRLTDGEMPRAWHTCVLIAWKTRRFASQRTLARITCRCITNAHDVLRVARRFCSLVQPRWQRPIAAMVVWTDRFVRLGAKLPMRRVTGGGWLTPPRTPSGLPIFPWIYAPNYH